MKVLSENDYLRFEHLCKLKEKNLHKVLIKYLKNNYGTKNVKFADNYIVANGTDPVCLIAHLDTVFNSPPTDIYYDQRQGVLWSSQGLGADDRAGVFIIINLISMGLRPHIIFTRGEETGGLGAEELTKFKCPFNDVRYLIELDRNGKNDCVFYQCGNEDFIKYIESFGFVEAIGSFTDISIIMPNWELCGVNLSVGYDREHSYTETLHISNLLDTQNKVVNMIKDANNSPKFKYEETVSLNNWYRDMYYSESCPAIEVCAFCGKNIEDPEFNMINIFDENGNDVSICVNCYEQNINFLKSCKECNNIYCFDGKEDGICPRCQEPK